MMQAFIIAILCTAIVFIGYIVACCLLRRWNKRYPMWAPMTEYVGVSTADAANEAAADSANSGATSVTIADARNGASSDSFASPSIAVKASDDIVATADNRHDWSRNSKRGSRSGPK